MQENQDSSSPEHDTNDDLTNAVETIRNMSFCVFDLETTGGNHQSDKIIEIGLIKIEKLKIVETKNYLIRPEIQIPDFIQKLTSIGPDEVEKAPLIEEVIGDILAFMGESILVAHNTSFDIPFFNSVLHRLGRPILPNRSICTNLMTKYLIPNLLNSNLNYMSQIFGIPHKKAHRALDDAKATAELFLRYIEIFLAKDIKKINHLYYPRNRYELDRINLKSTDGPAEIEAKIKRINAPFLFLLKGEDGVIQYCYPSSNADSEKRFLLSKLKEIPWKTLSVRLFGHFMEGLIYFNGHCPKLDPKTRNEIIKVLFKEHLSDQKLLPKSNLDNQLESGLVQFPDPDFGDFLIMNHLVPEQFVIYPLISLHHKSGLIFRYPGHQKKLIQFINSRASKMANNKMKKVHFTPHLREFVVNYLVRAKEKDRSLFIFKKSFPLKRANEFLAMIDTFLAENPNSYKYPKEYI